MIRAKICGLSTPESVDAALSAGAHFVGFVHHPRSPRHVDADTLGALTRALPPDVRSVLVTVDPDDDTLARLLSSARVDSVQLHGRETPARASHIAARFRVGIFKAFPVATAEDLDGVDAFAGVADHFLFDAKAPAGAPEGGNGMAFDWRILTGRHFTRPWFLSGGLHPGNVTEAVRTSGATLIDVSSGVEDAPGVKNPQKIRDFLAAVRML